MWDHIQKMNGKFEVLDHEPCPRACGPTVLNFYKKQMKSEKCEICNDIMISYVDAMVKIWKSFAQVITYSPYKSKHLHKGSI